MRGLFGFSNCIKITWEFVEMQILSHWSKLTNPKSLVVGCEDQDFHHFFWKRNTDENKLYRT